MDVELYLKKSYSINSLIVVPNLSDTHKTLDLFIIYPSTQWATNPQYGTVSFITCSFPLPLVAPCCLWLVLARLVAAVGCLAEADRALAVAVDGAGVNADPEKKKSGRTRKDDVAHFSILKTGRTPGILSICGFSL